MFLPYILHRTVSLLISILLLFGPIIAAQAQEEDSSKTTAIVEIDIPLLEAGKSIERGMKGEGSHFYRIKLATGQYIHTIVEQKGIELIVAIFSPDGKKVAEVNSYNGTQGPESILWVAETDGVYKLEVRSEEKDAPLGHYEVRIEELRQATKEDVDRIVAQKAFWEGEQKRDQGTAESLRIAIKHYSEALSYYKILGDRTGEANSLTVIGFVHELISEMKEALDYYFQAYSLYKALGDQCGEANTLTHIGRVYSNLGEHQKALGYYIQAMPLRKAVGDNSAESITLNAIGWVYYNLDEKQKALDYYNQALLLARSMGYHFREADTLNNIGHVYKDLGENQRALDYYNKALPVLQTLRNRRGEAVTLNSIGSVYSNLGEKKKALEYYNQALSIRRDIGDRFGEAVSLYSIGSIYGDMNEKQKALGYYDQALKLEKAVGNRFWEACTLNNIGRVYYDLGEKKKALEYYNQALPLREDLGDRLGEVRTLYEIARTEYDLDQLNEAHTQIDKALNIIESLRTKVVSQDLRISYLASLRSSYELNIELLMQLHKLNPQSGYAAAALQASEQSRARVLLEMLTESHTNIRQGIDSKLLERDRSLRQRLNAQTERLIRIKGSKGSEAEISTVENLIRELSDEYSQVQAEIRQKSPRYAALTQPQPLSLKEIQQQVLDSDTMLLEYSLGTDRSYLWAVTKTSITSFELPKREEIEKSALKVYELMGQDAENEFVDFETAKSRRLRLDAIQKERTQAVAGLSKTLLSPVAEQLRSKRLLIVADGVLHYVPFAALLIPKLESEKANDQKEAVLVPLIVKHEIVNLPSASVLAAQRRELSERKVASKTLAIFADPVFSKEDERITGIKKTLNGQLVAKRGVSRIHRSGELNRLPLTRTEALNIARLAGAQSRIALDFDASLHTITNMDLSQFRIIHFATHGFFDNTNPELSSVALSLVDRNGKDQLGFLKTRDVFNLDLSAELVVLSACETGLGKEIKGEGIVGLTRGFMYAGAARVLVSLWQVDDAATAELMKIFYYKMLKEGKSPAAALREAQVAIQLQPKWASPYFWAAFSLQGEPQ